MISGVVVANLLDFVGSLCMWRFRVSQIRHSGHFFWSEGFGAVKYAMSDLC